MPEQLQKIIQPIKSRWDTLARGQKIRLVSAIAVVLLALAITIYFSVRTVYEPLIPDVMDSRDMLNIETVLADAGIAYQVRNGTDVYVDRNAKRQAMQAIDTNPVTANTVFTYEDALSLTGMSTTETQKRDIAIRVEQSEIEQALLMLDGIVEADVELNIPDTGLFLNSLQNQSSAAVFLSTSYQFDSQRGQAIARAVTRMVEGLLIENVEVYDTQLNVLYSGMGQTANDGLNSLLDRREQEANKVEWNIRAGLLPIYDDVKVTINPIYDKTLGSEIRRITHEPPISENEIGLPSTEHTESTQAEGTNPAQEPGLGSNDQASGYDTGDSLNTSASSDARDVDYLYNTEERTTEEGAGSYLRDVTTLSTICYIHRDIYQEEYMAADTTRTDADWEAYKDELNNTLINDPNQAELINSIMKASGLPEDNISFTVYEIPLPHDYEAPPTEINQIIMFALLALLILMLALGLIRRQKQVEEEEEMEPELSVEDLLVSTQLEEAREEAEKLEEIDYSKESEVKKQIEKFVNEKPEAVAALLRNWLNNEEW